MIEYIIYTFIFIYYAGFCGAVAYVSCKEYQEERRQRIREYDELSRENPGIEMYTESHYMQQQQNYANRFIVREERLESIKEDDNEEKVFDIV
jgi:hypothetical protein